MKRKIAVITGSRADYGLLYWTLKEIQVSEQLELQLIVTGAHLSEKFGLTYKKIEEDGFLIDKKIDIQVLADSANAIAKSMGLAIIGLSQAYEELKPDIILVLGDRYEILAAVSAALPFNIPIAHFAGGEITEGAIDEQIRHAITKMSHIHFPGADIYFENVLKMGEEQWRIFNVGDPAIENIRRTKLIEKDLLFRKLDLNKELKTFLITLHPVTLDSREKVELESKNFFDVIQKYTDVNIVITYPNSDTNGDIIINKINELSSKNKNIKVFMNLGNLDYLSLMKACDIVLGNSSSAIAEAPVFKKPVVDYGDRQKGRKKADNIISVKAESIEFEDAIGKCLIDYNFLQKARNAKSIYGDGETSKRVVEILSNIKLNQRLIRKKLIFR